MNERSLMQSFQNFFNFSSGTTVNTTNQQYRYHSTSELLAFSNIVKTELLKLKNGVKSSIADVKALKGDTIKYGIVICEYTTNIMLGNPIDDSLLELEKIITMLSILPSDSQFGAHITKIFLGGIWMQIPHPPPNFENRAGHQWRTADGSNNNFAFPEVGKSHQKYIQNYRSKCPRSEILPDPGLIFDELLMRRPDSNGRFKANESCISSNLFYFATLITHDLFNTDDRDRTINLTTSYVDLSPLYGWTKQLQDSVRTGKNGLLKPDQYVDTRFWLQPNGVIALLVLFSRNHNYLAKMLLKLDENRRFSSLPDNERDEALFQTARIINERTYAHIILHDYLRVIFGLNRTGKVWTLNILQDFSGIGTKNDIPRATGNQCSLEFNFIYRWHHAISIEDEQWLENKLSGLVGNWKDMDMKTLFQKLAEVPEDQKQHHGLARREDGYFEDVDLARALIDGCNHISGASGGQNTPAALRNVEISGILFARSMGVCTLNEYRSFLKLKKYQSFYELNPDLTEQLGKLYLTIDDVELYPGLLCERRKSAVDGSGLCAGYTTSFGILADAVALVRGDRFHSKEGTHFNLTNFGMEDSQSDSCIDFGTLIGRKLIARHLSSVFKQNNVYSTFPFTLPSESWKNLGEKRTDYDFTNPLQ